MRLDLFLKQSRLIPRRTVAAAVCQQGAIFLNGQIAKGSKSVKVGDLICWHQPHRVKVVKILRIPEVSPSKKDAASLYELVETDKIRA